MGQTGELHQGGQHIKLVNQASVTANGTVTTVPITMLIGANYLVVEAQLTVGSAGGTLKVYIQTSIDGGLTWIDITQFAFTTATAAKVSSINNYITLAASYVPTDGTMADNTILGGLLGEQLRVKYISAGTAYGAGTILRVDALIHP